MTTQDVDLYYVSSSEDLHDFWAWVATAPPSIAFDLETSGVDPYHDSIRLYQVGDSYTAFAFPVEWAGPCIEFMCNYRGIRIAHNATFDCSFLEQHPQYGKDLQAFTHPANLHDTMFMARILWPNQPAGLKQLTEELVDPNAKDGQKLLKEAMRKGGWGWHDVPTDLPEYWVYGCLDVCYTHRLYHRLSDILAQEPTNLQGIYELEMEIAPLFRRMRHNGIKVDRDKAEALDQKYRDEVHDTAVDIQERWNCRPTVNDQIAKALVNDGIKLTERTATGKYKMSAAILESIDHPLAHSVLDYRHAAKLQSTYTSNILQLSERDGRLHAETNQLEASTGRSCLPTSHSLWTTSGVVSPENIEVGMETIDASGAFVSVLDVFHYEEAPVIWFKNGTTVRAPLGSTPEHRWVLKTQSKKKEFNLDVVSVGTYDTILLAPRRVNDLFDAAKRPDGFGARLGYLVTDGTCVWYDRDQEGITAKVYQCDRKFLDDIRQVFSGFISSEYIRNGEHYEIKLRGSMVRDELESNGLFVQRNGVHLKDNPSLVRWVSTAPLDEVENFFRAAYLSDGATARHHRHITCGSENLRTALQVAGYRLGYTSRCSKTYRRYETVPTIPGIQRWGEYEDHKVLFQQATMHMKSCDIVDVTLEPVWCVQTESGSFTAFNEDGPYLTGNSMSKPNLQNVPQRQGPAIRSLLVADEGNVLLSCDYSQQELRILAHLSDDQGLRDLFNGTDDPFVYIGSKMFPDDPFKDKKDPRRDLIKAVCYAQIYGAGVRKLADQTNLSVEEATQLRDTFFYTFPGVKSYVRDTIRTAERMDNPHAFTVFGRKVSCDKGYEYKLANYRIQGTAADQMKMALADLQANDLGHYLRICVHDEVILEVPEHMAAEIATQVEQIMAQAGAYAFSVPFVAEAVAGHDYGAFKG